MNDFQFSELAGNFSPFDISAVPVTGDFGTQSAPAPHGCKRRRCLPNFWDPHLPVGLAPPLFALSRIQSRHECGPRDRM